MVVIKKLYISLCMLAFSAGIIFLACGFTSALPKGVTVNGVEVGGLTARSAIVRVREEIERELKGKTLKIIADRREYKFTYPEISYTDDLHELIKTVKKGESYTPEITYYLCGIDEIAAGICLNESIPVVEPHADFSSVGEPFSYDEGHDGRKVDEVKLKEDILKSLSGGFEPVTVAYVGVNRKGSLETVRENTRLLARYTTYFDGTNINRVSNIRLAAAKLNGVVLSGGNTLSFNDSVGARVKERGFLPAKIIENGEYVEGVGGGVCQVSTTLYNAALLSGLQISEYHPHSLAVGYVPPSRDAMVSGSSCDLKIRNSCTTPVYIRAQVDENSVTFSLFGRPDGAEYSLSSEIIEPVPAPNELTDDPEKVREGRDGVKSECYLIINRGGYIKRVKLRSDSYLPTSSITLNENPPDGLPADG